MKSNEGFCEKHGPFDAALGRCPYCAQSTQHLPPAPTPLDEMPTDPWSSRSRAPQARYADDNEETDIGSRARRGSMDEDKTEFPQHGRSIRGGDDEGTETEWDSPRDEGIIGLLVVKEGQRRGTVYKLQEGTTVGRENARILLRDAKVSGSHARFRLENGQFVIWDLGSKNGTSVNGKQIREATPLNENDMIKIGGTVFVLKIVE